MSKEENESAFPIIIKLGEIVEASGLTKREYFTTVAMQSLLSSNSDLMNNAAIIRRSVKMADELIEQLKDKPHVHNN